LVVEGEDSLGELGNGGLCKDFGGDWNNELGATGVVQETVGLGGGGGKQGVQWQGTAQGLWT